MVFLLEKSLFFEECKKKYGQVCVKDFHGIKWNYGLWNDQLA